MVIFFGACTAGDPSDLFLVETRKTKNLSFQAPYWMTFHQCDTQKVDCFDPMKHETRLAYSHDGDTWSIYSDIPAFKGSVPDLLFREQDLYMYSLSREPLPRGLRWTGGNDEV